MNALHNSYTIFTNVHIMLDLDVDSVDSFDTF